MLLTSSLARALVVFYFFFGAEIGVFAADLLLGLVLGRGEG